MYTMYTLYTSLYTLYVIYSINAWHTGPGNKTIKHNDILMEVIRDIKDTELNFKLNYMSFHEKTS